MAITNILPQDIPVVRAEIQNDPASRGYAEKTADEIADLLSSQYEVDNPVTAPQVLKEINWSTLIASLTPCLATLPNSDLAHVEDRLKAGDREAAGFWLQIGVAKGLVTQEVATECIQALSVTEADPSWPAKVMEERRIVVVTSGRSGGIRGDEVAKIMGI